MKTLLVLLVVGIASLLIIPFLKFTPLQPQVVPSPTPTQQIIKKTPCQALTIKTPLPNQRITPPSLSVKVVVDNTNPECHWTVFEAQAGTLELQDENKNTIGTGTLTTTDEWMANKPVTYEGTVSFSAIQQGKGNLLITEENPSGKDTPQSISLPLNF